MATYLDYLTGAGETAATLGSGALAGLLGMPYGVYKGATSGKLGTREANRIAEAEAKRIMQQYTYQPRGQVAPQMMQSLGGLLDASKLPPVIPEAAMLASIPRQAVAAQAERTGMAAERAITPMVNRTMAKGGFGAGLLGDLAQGTRSPLDVYHGTPHTLPPTERNPLGEFDASKIGTGEGAQTFGYGIYTAENPAVAKDYQFMEQNWFDTSKAKYKGKSIDTWYEQAQKDQERAFKTNNKALEKDATARLAYWENIMTHNHPESVLKQFTDPEYGWDAATNYAKSIDINKFEGIPTPGNLYKVDLPDEKIATMLDWDKPLIDQNQNVLNAAKKLGFAYTKPQKLSYEDKWALFDKNGLYDVKNPTFKTKKEAQDFLKTNKTLYPDMTGAEFHDSISTKLNQFGGNDKKTAEFLNSYGISGIKYLDQFSREAGEGTRNFVTFPGQEKSMTILERNGMRGLLD
jgi:hypothetical protein